VFLRTKESLEARLDLSLIAILPERRLGSGATMEWPFEDSPAPSGAGGRGRFAAGVSPQVRYGER